MNNKKQIDNIKKKYELAKDLAKELSFEDGDNSFYYFQCGFASGLRCGESNVEHQGDFRDTPVLVIGALRYAMGRKSYAVGAIQNLINNNWSSLDNETKITIIRDVFEHIYNEKRHAHLRLIPPSEHDLLTWEIFSVEKYQNLNYEERKRIDEYLFLEPKRKVWYMENLMPKLHQRKI